MRSLRGDRPRRAPPERKDGPRRRARGPARRVLHRTDRGRRDRGTRHPLARRRSLGADGDAFVCALGIERSGPLEGAAAGVEPDVGERPGTVLVDFELPRDPRVLERVVQTVFEAHSYQEPVIKVREGWVSRSKGLDDGDNANRWWNTTGDWKKLDGLPGPKGA